MWNPFRRKEPKSAHVFVEMLHGDGNIPQIDFRSSTWYGIHDWVQIEMGKLRLMNDGERLSVEQTLIIRGQIKFAKKLLALAKPRLPEFEPEPYE